MRDRRLINILLTAGLSPVRLTEWVILTTFGIVAYLAIHAIALLSRLIVSRLKMFAHLAPVARFFQRDIWGNFSADKNITVLLGAADEADDLICGCIIASPTGRFGISRLKRNGQQVLRIHSLEPQSAGAMTGFQKRNRVQLHWSARIAEISHCEECSAESCPLRHCHLKNDDINRPASIGKIYAKAS